MRNAIFSLILISPFCISSTVDAFAQRSGGPASMDEADVQGVIDNFFDGMRAGDSTGVRSVLHPKARFITTRMREGEPVIHEGSVDGFVEAVGEPHDEIWDERIWNVTIHVDDLLAAAWMDYAFFLGSQLSHCGVNAFQFFKAAEGWKVIQVTDTRQTEGCDLPDSR